MTTHRNEGAVMNGTIRAALGAAGHGARRAAVLLCVVAAACSSNAPPATVTPPPKALRSLTVSPAPTFLATGDTRRLTAIGHYDDGSSKDLTAAVTWSSSNPVAAAVDAGGAVTAAGQGTTTVTATEAASG